MQHTIMVIEDDAIIAMDYAETVKDAGHVPVVFAKAEDAANYLGSYDRQGVPRHRHISMILCDYRLRQRSGEHVLVARNMHDPRIPFYLISGEAKKAHVEMMTRLKADGYIQKSFFTNESISRLLDNVLFDKIYVNRPVVFVKPGGSGDDYDIENPGKHYTAFMKTLTMFRDLRKRGYLVMMFAGAGKRGEVVKTRFNKYHPTHPKIKKRFPENMAEAVAQNRRDIADLVYSEEYEGDIFCIDPDYLSGRKAWGDYIPDISKFDNPYSNVFSVSDIFNSADVIVFGPAPRHLGMQFKGISKKGDWSYPYVPMEDSDAQMLLWANAILYRDCFDLGFNQQRPENFILAKRTKGIYDFDPYRGFRRGTGIWKNIQSQNRLHEEVNYKELLSDIGGISRIGAWDNSGGHLIEDSALKLFGMIDSLQKISVMHINPIEMHPLPDYADVVTGEPLPEKMGEDALRRRQLEDILDGFPYSSITK